eukprot:684849-Hanusia_phi.AAC.3
MSVDPQQEKMSQTANSSETRLAGASVEVCARTQDDGEDVVGELDAAGGGGWETVGAKIGKGARAGRGAELGTGVKAAAADGLQEGLRRRGNSR